MQYLLMIYSNEAEYAKLDPAASKKMSDEFEVFTKDIIQSGNFKAGDRLRPASEYDVRCRAAASRGIPPPGAAHSWQQPLKMLSKNVQHRQPSNLLA